MPARYCSMASIWPGGRRPRSCATASAARFRSRASFPRSRCEETMLAAVCADQRRASVLHRRFPLAETRDRAEHAMELLGLASKRNRVGGDAVAWRPKTARYCAGAGARSQSAAAGRAHRRHGHRRALAHDRQGARALGDAEDHGRVHRARHGHRVQDRAKDRRAVLRPHPRVRHAGCHPARSRP